MAHKFEKEEKFNYDSNSDSDGETNNSKSRSGSSSPTAQFEERVFNDTNGRRGGPNDHLGNCEHGGGRYTAKFSCNDTLRVGDCKDRHHFNCPRHPCCRRTSVS